MRRSRSRGSRKPARSRPGAAPDLSRPSIVGAIAGSDVPLALEHIASRLGVDSEASEEVLAARLKAMAGEGLVVRNRRGDYGVAERMDLIRGRVAAHRDGYGFVIPEAGGSDLYLAPREMRSLLHGDRVLVRVKHVDANGRAEAALVELLERANATVVGRFFRESGVGFVVPDNRRLHQEVLIPGKGRANARDGDIVVAEIVEQPTQHTQPVGRIVEILGDQLTPGLEIEVAIRAYGLPSQFPEPVLAEAQAIPLTVEDSAREHRSDLSALPFVTIDGADAKDFDDAVCCEPHGDGWVLSVAIADVSAYVRPGTALDAEARRRGTSVYFPGRVVPMLPERLSNGICSLNPGVARLALVCRMVIDAAGRVVRSSFAEAVIVSRARLTYEEVAAGIVEGEPATRSALGELVPHLERLHGLYRVLKGARRRRGAIELDTVEPRIVVGRGTDGIRRIERIEPMRRTVAHEIIEECMIAANVCAARLAQRHKLPALYRVHDGPSGEKLAELRLYLGELGLRLGGGDTPEPKQYAALMRRSSSRPDSRLVQTVVLRSMAQAVYRARNSGHFGLALPTYTHFTSPIRRYPDLLLHRVLRHRIRRRPRAELPHDARELDGLGAHTSMTERRAEEATRDVVALLKCEFMEDKVGRTYRGVVSAVTSFGVFVELPEVLVDGLVHVSALGGDYFHFDPIRHRLEGERTGMTYRLADPVSVRVARVDVEERKIDFELADGPHTPRRGEGGRSRRAGSGQRGRRRG